MSRRLVSAFTLVEVMIVITIIAALSSTLGVVGWRLYQRTGKAQAASLQVQAIAGAIESYGQRYWPYVAPGGSVTSPRNLLLWDLPAVPASSTGDGILDGEELASTYPAYLGFVRLTGYACNARDLDTYKNPAGTGRLVDPWLKPYRIFLYRSSDTARYGSPAVNPYGQRWFGIYSCGPDGLAETSDDIRSWGTSP